MPCWFAYLWLSILLLPLPIMALIPFSAWATSVHSPRLDQCIASSRKPSQTHGPSCITSLLTFPLCSFTRAAITCNSNHRCILLFPLCRGQNHSPERLSNLLKVTQLLSRKAEIQSLVCLVLTRMIFRGMLSLSWECF